MIRFIDVVNAFDKITDCIPAISTAKNAGIILYQICHKVNRVANPVQASWKDDIKIHVLTKDSFIAGMSMIPILGNATVLFWYLLNSVKRIDPNVPQDYLKKATNQFSTCLEKHGDEVVALYIARNPVLSPKESEKGLVAAIYKKNVNNFQLILDSTIRLSSRSILHLLSTLPSYEIANALLNKFKASLDEKDRNLVLAHIKDSSVEHKEKLLQLMN